MLINIDAKQIEWVAACYLSQDEVGIDELERGFDLHADNQKRFGLPTRVAAKVLLFRTIYGGSGYSFSVDPEFGNLGGEGWWDEKIAAFYVKYKGLYAWHERLYQRVVLDGGRLVLPTGRVYTFEPYTNQQGEKHYPRTKILNYPVQGLAADLMSLVRVSLFKRLKKLQQEVDYKILIVNSVHDSVILDVDTQVWYNILKIKEIVDAVFEDVPANFKKLFGVEFNLPLRADVAAGMDWKSMKEITSG